MNNKSYLSADDLDLKRTKFGSKENSSCFKEINHGFNWKNSGLDNKPSDFSRVNGDLKVGVSGLSPGSLASVQKRVTKSEPASAFDSTHNQNRPAS